MTRAQRYPLALVVSTHASRFAAVSFAGAIEERLASLSSLGFDGVELAIRDPKLLDAEELIERLRRHALRVPAIGTGQAYVEEGLLLVSASAEVRRAALERVLSHLPFAARLGAVVIVGLIGTSSLDGQTVDRALDSLASALRVIAAEASALGVRIAVEPVNRYESPLLQTVDDGLRLLAALDADNVGLLLDTFHMNIEETSTADAVRRAGDRIFHVHVADSNRWYPGAGHVDFSGILAALDDVAYGGFLSGEFLPNPSPDESATLYLDTMTALQRSRA
jgi:sugar phosphate isomerase/epimerase